MFSVIYVLALPVFLRTVLGTPADQTTLFYTREFFLGRQGGDSWGTMLAAVAYTRSEQREPLYTHTFFEQHVKLQYPPSSLLLFVPLTLSWMDPLLAALGTSPLGVVKWISWLLALIIIVATVRIADRQFRNVLSNEVMERHRRDIFLILIAILALCLTFYPLMKGIALGQIQTWITCGLTIALWLWMHNRKMASGMLAGASCIVKPQYSLLLFWGILRREWSFVWGFLLVSGIATLLSVMIFGLGDQVDYFRVLTFLSQHGEAYYPNQSVNGVLNRLLDNGENLNFLLYEFPPYHPVVHAGTLLGAAALLGSALFWPQRRSDRGSVLDLCIVLLSVTMASPIAWEHHYGVLLPIYAVMTPLMLTALGSRTLWVGVLCASYLLSSNFFAVANQFAQTPLNVLQSYLFAAAVLALLCLYKLSGRFGTRRA